MPDPAARRLWQLLEPVHAVTYFCPEPVTALRAVGYRGYWMGYFAGRAAPLGPVGPELVRAIFYNFAGERVAGALPDAWTFAPPGAALAARVDGSQQALSRILGPSTDSVERAVELCLRAATSASPEGRPLFAANLALPTPDEPLAALWHAATLLREHRGDGHVALLLAHGVGGRDSHVLRALASGLPRETYRLARDFDDDEWASCADALRSRGLLDHDDALTGDGRELMARIDARTDELAAEAYVVLDPDETDELIRLLEPLAAAVVRTGELPLDAPMGIDLRTVGG